MKILSGIDIMYIENTNRKEIQIITQLVKETASGKIEWDRTNPPIELISATESEIYTYFEAEYKGKLFAIYERREKNFYDEHEYYWVSTPIFAILNHNRNVLIEFSQKTPVLEDLFKTVGRKVADLDGLLDDLLS